MFQTEGEAKRFFIEKALQQASIEGVVLSEAERGMLSGSETDPELTTTAEEATALVEQLASEMSDDEYELKIATLLAGAYRREVSSEIGMQAAVWKDAYAKLNEGDHYITIMIMLEESLGQELSKKRSFWG